MTSGKSNSGMTLKLITLRTKQRSTTSKKQVGGTRLQRKIWLGNDTTTGTWTDHKDSDVHKTNGKFQSGGVNEKMRDARNVYRDQGSNMRDHFPREEEE